jgi:nicotinamide-nucleotide amidase
MSVAASAGPLVSVAGRRHNQSMSADALQKLAMEVGSALQSRGYSLAAAESCTGGWIGKAVTDIAGSSRWFERGFITYSDLSKTEQLGVDPKLLARYGAVSAAVVEAMATGALKYSTADIALAVSGIAGPEGGSPEKPVGTVWFAWALRDKNQPRIYSECSNFNGDREKVRYAAVVRGLTGILETLAALR